MAFIKDTFLLHSKTARHLYETYAADEPILDYHTHLPQAEIADNRRFGNLYQIWLEGDHYKWRAMRANGVPERFCTGDASPREKFLAWAKTVPYTVGNPLYHWTQLELKRYFDIDQLLDQSTARAAWDRGNLHLSRELTAKGILRKFHVRVVCTTDDPCEDLAPHRRVNSSDADLRIYPSFRPDQALSVNEPERFNLWLDRLEKATNLSVDKLPALLDALAKRHEAFHAVGGRLSDHGLPYCYANPCSDREASQIFESTRSGHAANPEE